MEMVNSRDSATLLPIVTQHVQSVHSDEWRAYAALQGMPQFNYRTVIHSLHFVDPNTGVHTQAIEGYWSRVKAKLKRMRGTSGDLLPTYLDEYMWRERFGGTTMRAFESTCQQIAEKYPVP